MEDHERARADLAAAIERLKLTCEAEFVPFSKSRSATREYVNVLPGAYRQPNLNWKVTIQRDGRGVLKCDYSAGAAFAPSHARLELSVSERQRLTEWECEEGVRAWKFYADGRKIMGMSPRSHSIKPDLVDVISSLAMDSDVLEYPKFEDWASEFGMSPDSRLAEGMYRESLAHALALRAAIGDDELSKLRDYARAM